MEKEKPLSAVSLAVENKESFTAKKITELLFKCIRNDHTPVSGMFTIFRGKSEYEILLAIVIKKVKGVDKEEWKACGVVKVGEKYELIGNKSEKKVSKKFTFKVRGVCRLQFDFKPVWKFLLKEKKIVRN